MANPEAADGCSQSLEETLQQLTAANPGTPFLALGQTVFWDEPLKAVVHRALDRVSPSTPLVLAVHDTDYFARPHATLASTRPYVILPHNDASTQNLWCAAGELSCLFGAETAPTRDALRAAGARLEIAARARRESLHDLLERVTEAWGWRGIAHTSGVEILTHEVALSDVLETLFALLEWGFQASAEMMCRCTGADQAELVAQRIRTAIDDAVSHLPEEATLSDLYQQLFPAIYALISGEASLPISHSVREARFNTETAQRPRFRIVDLFLRPESREICIQAYNNAVRGSEIYELDQFGEGSIPFDLVTPEAGRGTLRILDDGIWIEGRRRVWIPTERRIEGIQDLAEAVERQFGPGACLVGKAITWISILAADYMFVFHEGASGYTHRTRQMLREIRDHGIPIESHPILRIRYHAWDSLAAVGSGFCLPDHYAEAFGAREISAREFAARWRTVMDEQESLLLDLGRLRRPVDLLHFLEVRFGGPWVKSLADYKAARGLIRAQNAPAPDYRRQLRELRNRRYRCGIEMDRLQKKLGEIRRGERETGRQGDKERAGEWASGQVDEWTSGRVGEWASGRVGEWASGRVEGERELVQAEMDRLASERAALDRQIHDLRRENRALRASEEYAAALGRVRAIESAAELERIRLARNAYLVVHSLEHNDRRPTGWWLPMVSPDGAWFRAICASATAYVEEL